MPPLRERRGDIPALAQAFLDRLHQEGRTRLEHFSREAMEILGAYDWPGNVRQLKHVIEGAIYRVDPGRDQTILLPEHLPSEVRAGTSLFGEAAPLARAVLPDEGVTVSEELARMELSYIEAALRKSHGKKTEAWKLLGYNDRFAMRRRIKSILEKHPHLIEEHADLKGRY